MVSQKGGAVNRLVSGPCDEGDKDGDTSLNPIEDMHASLISDDHKFGERDTIRGALLDN